jgi:molybdate transport system permease protein
MVNFFLFLTYSVAFIFLLSFLSLLFGAEPKRVFKELFSDEVIFALKLTLETSLIATLITMLISIPVAYALARFRFPFKSLIRTFIDMPMTFPELVIGFLLLLLFSNFFDPLLRSFNIQIIFSKSAIVIAQILVALPFAVKILYTEFFNIDPKYEWVSRSLGYNLWETFLKVSLPMAKNGLVSALVVSFARAFGAFGAVLVFAGGVYMKTETLPIGLYLNLSYGNMERAIAMGFVLILTSFLTLSAVEFLYKTKKGRFS